MWWRADSALAVMMEFAGSPEADSLDAFNGHYCQVLISELLYKNYYRQSNRKDLLKAVDYFDSIGNGFLAARAHYINGVGYAEKDSAVEACGEYLFALRTMESHYHENELLGTKACFMVCTYNRLAELFSGQFMQEPAIFCGKKALVFNNIEPVSPFNRCKCLMFIGKQYSKLNQYDSSAYYYDEALKQLPDTNNLIFRDLISARAFLFYIMGKEVEPSVNDLRRMAVQTTDETEKLNRYLTIGSIYSEEVQYDSALVYLTPVFEDMEDAARQRIAARYLYEIFQNQGDTLKAAQFSMYIAGNTVSEGESNAQVSQLNELFQQHLQWEQERADAERQGKIRVQRNRMIVATGILAVLAALTAWLLHRRKMKEQREEANQQIEVEREAHRLESQKLEAEREAHRLEKASMSGRLKKSNQEVRELKDQIKRQEEVNAKPQQAESFTDEPICRLIMERVREGQFKAQMDCKLYKDAALSKEQVTALRDAADRHFNLFTVRLAKAYPNLTKNDLDYCCLYLLGLSDADISALMQRAYTTVNDRGRKMKAIFGTEEPLSVTLRSFAEESTSN
jgi:tetratricopeptide (TPR) repeat protein